MTSATSDQRADAAKERDQFIPVRKADVLGALVEHGAFGGEDERDRFRQICRLLAAIYHYEYFDELFDKFFLSVPALAGAVPILLNLASTVTVLFLVLGFYLGVVAAVEHDEMKTAFAAMSGLVALVGFIMRQWLRYQRQSLKYQKELTDNCKRRRRRMG